jgi:hypothetical protein
MDQKVAIQQTVEWERHHLAEVPVDYAEEDRLLADFKE